MPAVTTSTGQARVRAADEPAWRDGSANDALEGADVFIGLSSPGAVSADAIRTMAPDAIVFAMANPTPEVLPEEIEGDVAVIATGRSDYPNQINNVLAFPGVFRGALDVRASTINDEMELAAAHAIADVVDGAHLSPDYVIPSVFNRDVAHGSRECGRRGCDSGPESPERKGGPHESQGRHDKRRRDRSSPGRRLKEVARLLCRSACPAFRLSRRTAAWSASSPRRHPRKGARTARSRLIARPPARR